MLDLPYGAGAPANTLAPWPCSRNQPRALGGWIDEPVWGIGERTGSLWSFGQRGREYVMPEDRMRRTGGGETHIHKHLHIEGVTYHHQDERSLMDDVRLWEMMEGRR